MRVFKKRYFIDVLAVLVLAGSVYYFREDLCRLFRRAISQTVPCQVPITYSIGNIDPRFGLTKAQVLVYVEKAEKIWENPIGKDLFASTPTGDLEINLIYDERQKDTDELKKIGVAVNNDRATYDSLKAKYDQLVAAFDNERSRVNELVVSYNAEQAAYEKDADFWNKKGGAPKAQYDLLLRQRASLDEQAAAIDKAQNALNASVDTINSAAAVLNKLIDSLNLQVAKYNTIGASNGQPFDEGVYTSDANGTTIDIYQFNDTAQLVRLFAHELGHALGLEHLNNPKAIMYYLNEGTNETLIADDLTALKAVCGIK